MLLPKFTINLLSNSRVASSCAGAAAIWAILAGLVVVQGRRLETNLVE